MSIRTPPGPCLSCSFIAHWVQRCRSSPTLLFCSLLTFSHLRFSRLKEKDNTTRKKCVFNSYRGSNRRNSVNCNSVVTINSSTTSGARWLVRFREDAYGGTYYMGGRWVSMFENKTDTDEQIIKKKTTIIMHETRTPTPTSKTLLASSQNAVETGDS